MAHVLDGPRFLVNLKRLGYPREVAIFLGIDSVFVEDVHGRFVLGNLLRRSKLNARVLGIAIQFDVAVDGFELADKIDDGVSISFGDNAIRSRLFNNLLAVIADPVDEAGDRGTVLIGRLFDELDVQLLCISDVPQVVTLAALLQFVPSYCVLDIVKE